MQLLARIGVKVDSLPLDEEELEFRYRLKDEWIDIEKLEELNHTFALEQVAFWDEIHIHQVVGCHKKKNLIVLRNEDGIYDDNGTFKEIKKVRLTTIVK